MDREPCFQTSLSGRSKSSLPKALTVRTQSRSMRPAKPKAWIRKAYGLKQIEPTPPAMRRRELDGLPTRILKRSDGTYLINSGILRQIHRAHDHSHNSCSCLLTRCPISNERIRSSIDSTDNLPPTLQRYVYDHSCIG